MRERRQRIAKPGKHITRKPKPTNGQVLNGSVAGRDICDSPASRGKEPPTQGDKSIFF